MRPDFEDTKRRVREANDIVAVVNEVVPLKKSGSAYKALCPFHKEKTPSFYVNPGRQIFKCFGCGLGGDVFSFVMKYNRVEFPEALRMLADRAGIEVSWERVDKERAGRVRTGRSYIYKVNKAAEEWFRGRLTKADGKAAREYLKGRGFKKQTIAAYGTGWAGSDWDGLTASLRKKGVPEQWAENCGLARRGNDGSLHDFFRNRIIFPIRDVQSRVVGFGGRVLDDSVPKYLNTPETEVFKKGSAIFGLDLAHDAMRTGGKAVLVEGYTDVMMCRQAGIMNAIAAMGTACTADHVRLLRRFVDEVYVVFDADAAGQSASERALELLLTEDLAAHVVVMPGEQDPCEFIRERGREEFESLLQGSTEVFSFFVSRVRGKHDLSSERGRAAAAGELMEKASRAKGRVLRDLYRKRIAEEFGIREDRLKFSGVRSRPAGNDRGDSGIEVESLSARAERDRGLAAVVAAAPAALAEEAAGVLQYVSDEAAREVLQAAAGLSPEETADADVRLLDAISGDAALSLVADAAAMHEGKSDGEIRSDFHLASKAVRLQHLEEHAGEAFVAAREAEKAGDSDAAKEMYRRNQELRKEISELRASL